MFEYKTTPLKVYSKSLFPFLLALLFWACSVENNKINKKEWLEVKEIIFANNSFKASKKDFIIDQFESIFANQNEFNKFQTWSFTELIDELDHQYDSLELLYKSIHKTNLVLDEILDLEKAESVSLDADRGFIIFRLKFNKVFDDPIDYMILRYQYIDDYDQVYFTEDSKLSYQAAGNFDGELQSVMTDIFNGENEIIYLKTELSAAEVLRDNYGIEAKTESLEKEYLSNGLKVFVSLVRLRNGGIMKRRNGDWKYLKSEI